MTLWVLILLIDLASSSSLVTASSRNIYNSKCLHVCLVLCRSQNRVSHMPRRAVKGFLEENNARNCPRPPWPQPNPYAQKKNRPHAMIYIKTPPKRKEKERQKVIISRNFLRAGISRPWQGLTRHRFATWRLCLRRRCACWEGHRRRCKSCDRNLWRTS